MPLDEAVEYATHVLIRCRPPIGGVFKFCGHSAIWRTAELQERLPRCRTYGEFVNRLYCRRCKLRGWLSIEPARR